MKVQQINYNGRGKYKQKTVNQSNVFIPNQITNLNTLSFKGLSGAEEFFGKVTGKTSEIIKKTINEVTSSFKPIEKKLQALEGNYEEIGKKANENRAYIEGNYWRTKKKLKKVTNNEIERKNQELLSYEGDVITAEITAKTNQIKAAGLHAKLEALDPIHAIERHRKIVGQYSGNDDKVGFEKIAGYYDVKKILETCFFKAVDDEKAGKKARIPGFFLFFGPTGNGKSTFTRAVAEETGCKIIPVDVDDNDLSGLFGDKQRIDLFDLIKEEAENAEKRFKETKTRTILYIDELTKIISAKSNLIKEFQDFAKTCSENYHCTIFGATNHMSAVALDIKETKPIIISVDPPTKDDTIAVLHHYLKDKKIIGNIDYDFLTNSLIKKGEERGGIYSNSQIKGIIEYSFKDGQDGISQADILETIGDENKKCPSVYISPAITFGPKRVLENFEKDYKKYILGEQL